MANNYHLENRNGTWYIFPGGNLSKADAIAEAKSRNNPAASDPLAGIAELRAAQDTAANEEYRYNAAIERMMDDEHNDGINPPISLDQSLGIKASELAARYPRAAMYLRAEGYTQSNNFHKYSAGKKAMELIANGGKLEEASEILQNWLPKESCWD